MVNKGNEGGRKEGGEGRGWGGRWGRGRRREGVGREGRESTQGINNESSESTGRRMS